MWLKKAVTYSPHFVLLLGKTINQRPLLYIYLENWSAPLQHGLFFIVPCHTFLDYNNEVASSISRRIENWQKSLFTSFPLWAFLCDVFWENNPFSRCFFHNVELKILLKNRKSFEMPRNHKFWVCPKVLKIGSKLKTSTFHNNFVDKCETNVKLSLLCFFDL